MQILSDPRNDPDGQTSVYVVAYAPGEAIAPPPAPLPLVPAGLAPSWAPHGYRWSEPSYQGVEMSYFSVGDSYEADPTGRVLYGWTIEWYGPMYSPWAVAHHLQGIEDTLMRGAVLSAPQMAYLESVSSIAPAGWIAGERAGNQGDVWSDFVARIQDREAPGDFLGIKGIGMPDDWGPLTVILAAVTGGLASGIGAGVEAGAEEIASAALEGGIADTVTLAQASAPLAEAEVIYPEVELAAAAPEIQALPEVGVVAEPLDALPELEPGTLPGADAPLVEDNVTFPEPEPELELAPAQPDPIAQVEPKALTGPAPAQAADAPMPAENVSLPQGEASPELELTPEPDGPVAGTDAPMPAENVSLPPAAEAPSPLPTPNSPISLSSLTSPLLKKLTAAAGASRSSAAQASPIVRSAPIDPPAQAYGFAPSWGASRGADAGGAQTYGVLVAAVLGIAAVFLIGR